LSEERIDVLIEEFRRECRAALKFVRGVDKEEFLSSDLLQHAVSMAVIAIGEYATRIVKASPDFVASHPAIPWMAVIGMRNRIAHGYYGLDFNVVWDTVTTSIPELLAALP
jgi:uncharacterized protein with HEPN domain